ncbi:hypothetical protein N665_0157s0036 [Sinapis alba]|nr:hypothetical protein N665_0157s0036 [Sinapis alba]
MQNPDDGLVVRAFQLLFSLRNFSLDLNNGTLPTVSKRLILALSTSTLMFAAKMYQVPKMCSLVKLEETDVKMQLSEPFTPDDAFMWSPSPSIPQVISIGQLMESVAGEVVVSSVSTTPLPYKIMTNRCETFGTGTRQKLSTWGWPPRTATEIH